MIYTKIGKNNSTKNFEGIQMKMGKIVLCFNRLSLAHLINQLYPSSFILGM